MVTGGVKELFELERSPEDGGIGAEEEKKRHAGKSANRMSVKSITASLCLSTHTLG